MPLCNNLFMFGLLVNRPSYFIELWVDCGVQAKVT
jgi:hypothetical protein